MNNIHIYLDMLGLKPIQPPTNPQPNILRCCGPVEANPKEGNYSCILCGLVKDPYYIVQEEEPHYTNCLTPLGLHSRYTYTRTRYYTPLTHFREHVRRYLGARFTDIPDQLLQDLRDLNLPIQQQDAFKHVKQALRTLRWKTYTRTVYNYHTKFTTVQQVDSNAFYKEIFTIIYLLGGQRPQFNRINELYQKYKELVYFFNNSKIQLQRHNMPCNYMLLDILLRELGSSFHSSCATLTLARPHSLLQPTLPKKSRFTK